MQSRTQWGETAIGFVVLALAAAFLAYVLGVAGVGKGGGAYTVSAKFGDAGSLTPGAKVTVSGVKVGTVSSISIDAKSYLAVVTLALDNNVKVPSDSTAKITSDGLLGGAHISLAPGGANDDLKAGDEITNTQGAVDLFGLIGQVMRPHSDAQAAAAAPSVNAPATPPATSAATPTAAANLPDVN